MNLRLIPQLFSVRDLRNAALGLVIVVGGCGLAAVTLYAHQAGNIRLAGISAGVSLVFVLLILLFVVPPLARNASREASQLNLPFEFTAGGAVMLVLVAVVGFSAWNTGNNLLFLVLSFLLATMFVGFYAGRVCLKKLDVKMRFPETIFAGEPTPLIVVLTNRKRYFPSFSVVAEVRGQNRDRSIVADELLTILPRRLAKFVGRPPIVRRTLDHLVHVPRNGSVESRTDHIFSDRGRFLIKNFELSTRFPFGFFKHRRRLPARETELIVFPKPLEFKDIETELPLELGQLAALKRGMGQDLLALRAYQPKDDLRRIDWKATARSQNLTVREFAAEDELRVTVVFHTRTPQNAEEPRSLRDKIAIEQRGETVILSERFETGVSTAASILLHFAEEQAELRLIIDDKVGEFGVGRGHLYDALKRLSLAEPTFFGESTLFEPPPSIERILDDTDNSHCFVVAADAKSSPSDEFVQSLKIIGF